MSGKTHWGYSLFTCVLAAAVSAYRLPAGEVKLEAGKQLAAGIKHGLELRDGGIVLFSMADDFDADFHKRYKVSAETSFGENEYGIIDPAIDAAEVTFQVKPKHCLMLESFDNDSVSLYRNVFPTVKGWVQFDFQPLRIWPTNGKLTVQLRENGERYYRFPLAGGDYKFPMVKRYDGKELSAPGGPPYFTPFPQHNIYLPSEEVPESARYWRQMRLLFRPAYSAGSMDGSVCREIEDGESNPIVVKRLEIDVGQLETCIKSLRFKALLGDAVSPALESHGERWASVAWDADVPDKTRVGVQVRGADTAEGLEAAEWLGPKQGKSYFLETGSVPDEVADKKFLQLRLLLKATIDASFEITPSVRSITVTTTAAE